MITMAALDDFSIVECQLRSAKARSKTYYENIDKTYLILRVLRRLF